MSKISFRFFNDRPVRAIGDEYLKNKLKADGNEVVSETNQLRLTAPDGKRRWSGVSLTARKSRAC